MISMNTDSIENVEINVSVDDFSPEAFDDPILLMQELDRISESSFDNCSMKETIAFLQDFDNTSELYQEFISEVISPRMSFSYKPILVKAMMELSDSSGAASLTSIINYYFDFYRWRNENTLFIEKQESSFIKYPLDFKRARNTILTYPYKRLAARRFMTYNKVDDTISIVPDIWKYISKQDKKAIIRICDLNIEKYYQKLSSSKILEHKRQNIDDVPFCSLFIGYIVGYYIEDQNTNRSASFKCDINAVVMIEENRLIIANSDDVLVALEHVEDISVSPILCKTDRTGSFFGVPNWKNDKEIEIDHAAYVNAPFLTLTPLVFECKIVDRSYLKLTAEIVNINVNHVAVNENETFAISSLFENITFLRGTTDSGE